MQTSTLLAQSPPDNRVASDSLLDQHLPSVSEDIVCALGGPADLVAYRVRQAINDGLTSHSDMEKLLSVLRTKPQSDQSYTRHVLHADPGGRFTVVALVWGPTHSSPVHAHHTWCAYRIVEGALTESHYEWDSASQKAYLFNKVTREAGQSVCGNAGLASIHRLVNETSAPAISIHAYGVDVERISTHVNHIVPWSEKN